MRNKYDRYGTPIPDDWWDKAKHGDPALKWVTDSRVGSTVVDGVTVSTVWMGIDHNHSGMGSPLIFETMVFGGDYDYELQRYSTEEQALRGHLDTVDRVRAGRPPFEHLESSS